MSYLITVSGLQEWDGDTQSSEMKANGRYYEKPGGYVIEYDEHAPSGGGKVRTTLEFERRGRVILRRDDGSGTSLVFEKGKRETCAYGTPQGQMLVGICTQSLESSLGADGGMLNLLYTVDINSSYRCSSRINISVKETKDTIHGNIFNPDNKHDLSGSGRYDIKS